MYFKIIVAFIALATVSVNTAPVDEAQNPAATLLKYSYEPNANNDGGYSFEYETSDGQKRSETASVKYVGEENLAVLSVNGVYSYVGPDGVTYTVKYLADENGFNASGDHIAAAGVNNAESVGKTAVQQQSPSDIPRNDIISPTDGS